MDVYHNGNIIGTGRKKDKLTAVPVGRTFLWEGEELFLPAVYVGKAGAAVDVCAKILVEDMATFLKKWPWERRLSLKTQEEYDQIEADNPGCKEFLAQMSLDGQPLNLRMGSSINWYPENIFKVGNENLEATSEEEWKNDKAAEKLMEAYSLDRECCWHFWRITFDWKGESILSPQSLLLTLQARPSSITAGHFTTHTSLTETTVRIVHPADGQEYLLALHGCEQSRYSFADIGAKDMIYPEYFQSLSYSISPEIDRSLFDIRDCAESDKPRKADASSGSSGSGSATAVFMAGKSPDPDRRIAVSSMHFAPVEKIWWRVVFQVKKKEDMEISFSL